MDITQLLERPLCQLCEIRAVVNDLAIPRRYELSGVLDAIALLDPKERLLLSPELLTNRLRHSRSSLWVEASDKALVSPSVRNRGSTATRDQYTTSLPPVGEAGVTNLWQLRKGGPFPGG